MYLRTATLHVVLERRKHFLDIIHVVITHVVSKLELHTHVSREEPMSEDNLRYVMEEFTVRRLFRLK